MVKCDGGFCMQATSREGICKVDRNQYPDLEANIKPKRLAALPTGAGLSGGRGSHFIREQYTYILPRLT